MIVNDNFLNIPPYLSTSWENVRSLKKEGSDLIVQLIDGSCVAIPELSDESVNLIFGFHSKFLQKNAAPLSEVKRQEPAKPESALRFGISNIEGFQSALQHNPQQASAPNLPDEVLQKISAIAKIVAPEEMGELPKPEPHCNCPHCQIARAIASSEEASFDQIEEWGEEIPEEELKFEQWNIRQTGDHLFTVTNKLDPDEQYNVFLGKPVGCTCGSPDCEHILAVLKS